MRIALTKKSGLVAAGVLVAMVLIAGVLVFWVGRVRWEYKTTFMACYFGKYSGSSFPKKGCEADANPGKVYPSLDSALNGFGQDGWEVIKMDSNVRDGSRLFGDSTENEIYHTLLMKRVGR